MKIARETFREIAGIQAQAQLKDYEKTTKAVLMLFLVDFTQRLEKTLFGEEKENERTSDTSDTLQP